MKQVLCHLIENQSWQPRLDTLAIGAPASAPLSITLALDGAHTDWLEMLPKGQPFWYRAKPSLNEFRLGIGHALHLATAGNNRFAALDNAYQGLCRDWRHEGVARAFAGFAFDHASHSSLPNALLAIPAILLEYSAGKCAATLTIPATRRDQASTEWLALLKEQLSSGTIQRVALHPDDLAKQAWMARVRAALRAIEQGKYEKLVLSRSFKIESRTPLPISRILGNLIDHRPDSLIYAHGDGEHTFLGASPERLLKFEDGKVYADALAGTAWAGSPSLGDRKNRHEQSLVVGAIIEALAPLCTSRPHAEPPAEHPAGHLRHLLSRISGNTQPETSLFDLVNALHPTPAVGGFPREAAEDWLRQHGEKRSGWYSGALGLLDHQGNGEFSVALRSALISGCSAELQAGAGIVAGSEAHQELAETEAKLQTLLAALETPTGDQRTGTLHN